MNVYQSCLSTPIGNLLIKATDKGLTEVSLTENIHLLTSNPNDILLQTKIQLEEYFSGERTTFNIPMDIEGYSEFFQSVWQALLNVPYGRTNTYSDIAKAIGDLKAVRAVGLANGKNPIAIIVPCHRIIGKGGKLVGYAWGLETKKWLLRHELAHAPVPEHMLF